MPKIGKFFKQYFKFIILALIVLAIVISLIASKKKSDEIDVYKSLEQKYFAMYSIDNKVGVIDTKGEVIVEPIYSDVYIPNPEKDVFFCYNSTTDYVILNSNSEELFTDYEKVSVLQTSESNLDFEKYVLKFEKDGKYGLIDLERKYNSSSNI